MAMKKKDVNWVGLELAYRTGRSFRSLAREFGISSTRIKQVADDENWARDLTAVIAERARAKLNASNVNTNLNGKSTTERAIVDATVQVQTDIVLAHRRDIQRGRTLVVDLLGQLESQVAARLTDPESTESAATEDGGLCGKPVTLATQASTLKTLSEALKTLIALERQAFNVDDVQQKPSAAASPAATPAADPRSGFEDLRAAFQRVLARSSGGDHAEGRIVGLKGPGGNH